MQNSSVGINFNKLDGIEKNIVEYAEKINKVLNDISEVNEKIYQVLTYDDVEKIRNKYDLIKTNYSVIVNNILSYNNDFSKIKSKVNAGEDELKCDISREITKLDSDFSVK